MDRVLLACTSVSALRYRPTQETALILSPDALGAALVGAAVEALGVRIGFLAEGESAREALRRIRPCCVLVDCDDRHATDEAFIGPAMMMGARIVLFGPEHRMRMHRQVATRFRMGVLALPHDAERLSAILDIGVAADAPLERLV